jgi:FMN-dependent NADH-azoreductase
MQLLRIECSFRKSGSRTRMLTDRFLSAWGECNPDANIVTLELSELEAHPSQAYWAARDSKRGPTNEKQEKLVALAEGFISAIRAADKILISAPMYNFNVPSTLKAFIDFIIQDGRTYAFDGKGNFEGLLNGKKLLLIATSGGQYAGSPEGEAYDFQTGYIATVFGFLGITDFTSVRAEGLDYHGHDIKAGALANATTRLTDLAKTW